MYSSDSANDVSRDEAEKDSATHADLVASMDESKATKKASAKVKTFVSLLNKKFVG